MTTEQYSIGYEAGYQDGWDAALAEQPAEQVPVAWMSPGKERLEFSRKDTVYGSHTIPLYTAPQPAIPPEFKLVPVEPTPEMMRAAFLALESEGLPTTRWMRDTYRAMLNAAPEAPQPAKRVPLTDDEIDVLWAKQQTKPFKTHAEDRMAFARAIIAAYGAKCVPLTEEEISALWLDSISGPLTAAKFARAVERAHGITGETK